MNFAATLTIRHNGTHYIAGFASETKGMRHVANFGRWFGSQMSYKPFKRTLNAAKDYAERLNKGTVHLDPVSPEFAEETIREFAAKCGFAQ